MKLPYLDLDQLSAKLQETAEVMGARLRATDAYSIDDTNKLKDKVAIIEQCLQSIVLIEAMKDNHHSTVL